MPELPEVEVVRAGLASALAGARVAAVEVRDPRALKRHLAGPVDFERRATGALLLAPARRGKFLWVPIAGRSAVAPAGAGQDPAEPSRREVGGAAMTQPAPTTALLGHLGMSGQMLLRSNDAADDRHVRVRLWIEHPEHGELRLDFADQRLFGSLAIDELVPTSDGRPAGLGSDLASIPGQAAHIARDPLDPAFDDDAMFAALRGRRTAVKRALLDQGLISGVGNIYADEALWRARLHPERPADSLSTRSARILLSAVRDVFAQALAEGGTSFDAQYVNVNGEAGYFAHSLNAYGRGGEACPRCGGPISREAFMNRSSHFCPRCQRRR